MKNIIIGLFFCVSFISCNNNNLVNNIPSDPAVERINRITAAFRAAGVEAEADNLDLSLKLKSITSNNVNVDGTSGSWTFKYTKNYANTFTVKNVYLRSSYNSIQCDSIVEREATAGDANISQKWFNSDKAMVIADKNGGNGFRTKYPDYIISASLLEAVVPNSTPYWYIRYSSKSDNGKYLVLNIDAVSGNVIMSNYNK